MWFGRKKRRIERLLVVEDEPLVAFDNEHVLTEAGFTIVGTTDRVADAVAEIASGKAIDLVLVDVNLTDGTGLDVARAAFARAIPALFVTGHCPPEAETFAAGCLDKPYAPRDLLGAIEAIEAAGEGRSPKRMPAGLRLFERV
jgi:DNA-binding response OmpR family regulator